MFSFSKAIANNKTQKEAREEEQAQALALKKIQEEEDKQKAEKLKALTEKTDFEKEEEAEQ